MISIDQNSHSLWDTLPKLQALAAAGVAVRHFVEDIDVAFTALGATSADEPWRIERERFHPSGGSSWGAALFYHDFLGRQPLEPRRLEPSLGMKIGAAAKAMSLDLPALYDQASTSDNWMLVGPSYVGDRQHHRVIGDISAAQALPFIREILSYAEADTLAKFPDPDSQQRTKRWFAAEKNRVESLYAKHPARLVDVYRDWLVAHLDGDATVAQASSLFDLAASPARSALLELFTRDYDLAAGLYNQALAETDLGLHPLNTKLGEMPFFAVVRHAGHHTRVEVRLVNHCLRIADREIPLGPAGTLPLDALRDAGVEALAGKAVLLVLQVRLAAGNAPAAPLALPHHGSYYVPASHRLAELLEAHCPNLLPGPLAPIVRVRLHFLDRLAELTTTIDLPAYLQPVFQADALPANELAATYREKMAAANQRLAAFRDPTRREAWLDAANPAATRELADLHARKRTLAQSDPKSPEGRSVWKEIKTRQTQRLTAVFHQVVTDTQVAELDFWDSRGAIQPWAFALGGDAFYQHVLANASLEEERHDTP